MTTAKPSPFHPEVAARPKDLASASDTVPLADASLVIQTAFLGDMILTTPLIAALAGRGPVDVVARPDSAALLANNPDVRDVIVYDKRGAARGVRGLWRMSRVLRRRADGSPRGISTAYLAQGSLRSAALARLAGIPTLIGFATSAGERLYTRRVAYRDDLHHAERLLRLMTAEGRDAPVDVAAGATLHPHLYPGAAEREQVDALLAPLGGAPFVALAPGSVWATKRWPYYAELAGLLSSRVHVVAVGGAPDAELAAAIVAGAGSRALDATGRLSLLASAELIGRAAVLVTNDSAPLHLASAMGTPTVAIFGPTVPEFGFGPLAPRSAVVGDDTLPCRPCDRHGPQRCPLGHWRCMRERLPEPVAGQVLMLLSIGDS